MGMEELANNILEIVKDYRNDSGIQITTDCILAWGNQFGDDAEFILSETEHILRQTYISKEAAIRNLKKQLVGLQTQYKYATMAAFIANAYLIDVQDANKSQPAILALVKEILVEEYGITYDETSTIENRKHYLYFDDVLASGRKSFTEITAFLELELHPSLVVEALLAGDKTLSASYFCIHQLGFNNVQWQLMQKFGDSVKKHFHTQHTLLIENQSKWDNQKLNFVIPIDSNNTEYNSFLANLGRTSNNALPYRRKTMPKTESFFSSPSNSLKYETIILDAGLRILRNLGDRRKANQRPLGFATPSHKSFGTGTLFFTWRNIPNNCPLIFWWEVPGHNWTPLFTLQHRG